MLVKLQKIIVMGNNFGKIVSVLLVFACVSCGSEDSHLKMNSAPEAFKQRSERLPSLPQHVSGNTIEREMTAAEFKKEIFDYSASSIWANNYGKAIVIDFYANWCRPCKMLSPVLHAAVVKYDGKVEVIKINIDKEKELAAVFNVQSIPTLLFCDAEGNQPVMMKGVLPEQELDRAIGKIVR